MGEDKDKDYKYIYTPQNVFMEQRDKYFTGILRKTKSRKEEMDTLGSNDTFLHKSEVKLQKMHEL